MSSVGTSSGSVTVAVHATVSPTCAVEGVTETLLTIGDVFEITRLLVPVGPLPKPSRCGLNRPCVTFGCGARWHTLPSVAGKDTIL